VRRFDQVVMPDWGVPYLHDRPDQRIDFLQP